jgi:catechol 2,3-dioxygenase-like lactoylglutathione lyase family enzyme
MDATAIDHLNLRVPADGTEAATDFYRDRLGFAIEGMDRYEADEKPFFDVRLAPEHVLHLWPTDKFEPPSGNGFNHVALLIDDEVAAIERQLDEAGVTIENRHDSPLGATGRAPAVYVENPFGYQVELKTTIDE